MSVEPRAAWATADMTCPPRNPAVGYRKGAAVHWPGDEGLVTAGIPHSACLRHYHDIETEQMSRKPPQETYGAIAYQVLVCNAHGTVTEGRTRAKFNGANGDPEVNAEYGSILALVGIGETPTPQLLAGILAARDYLKSGTVLKTHNDVRPSATACPGPALTAWIKAGYPTPQGDDDVAAADVWNFPIDVDGAGPLGNIRASTMLRRILQAVTDTDGLADAIVAKLGGAGGLTKDDVTAAIRDVFADAADPG